MKSSLLLLVVCVGLSVDSAAVECPTSCACVHHDMDCSSRAITQVPTQDISPHATTLNLSRNNLTSLHHDTFRALGHATSIDLSYNQIANVSAGAFSHMENVMSINLSGNNISHIEFRHVRSDRLHALYLSHNPHLHLPERGFELRHLKVLEMKRCELTRVPHHFFARTERIEVLELGHNKLSSLEGHTLSHLKHLVYLDLSGNRFVALPAGLLQHLDVSVLVKLGGNPFVCECRSRRAYAVYVTHRGHAPLHCSFFAAAQAQTVPLSHHHYPDFYRDHCGAPAPPTSEDAPAREPSGGSPADHRGAIVAGTLSAILVVAVVVVVGVRVRRNVRLGDTTPQRFSILKVYDEV